MQLPEESPSALMLFEMPVISSTESPTKHNPPQFYTEEV